MPAVVGVVVVPVVEGVVVVVPGGANVTEARLPTLVPGIDPQVLNAVAPRLQHRELHDHFRFGLIDIVDDLFRQHHLVRRVAHDDGILRVELLHAAEIQQLAQAVDDFR